MQFRAKRAKQIAAKKLLMLEMVRTAAAQRTQLFQTETKFSASRAQQAIKEEGDEVSLATTSIASRARAHGMACVCVRAGVCVCARMLHTVRCAASQWLPLTAMCVCVCVCVGLCVSCFVATARKNRTLAAAAAALEMPPPTMKRLSTRTTTEAKVTRRTMTITLATYRCQIGCLP